MQPRKYSKKTFKMEFQKKPKTASKVLEMPAVLGYEELGGLSGIDPLGTARKLPREEKEVRFLQEFHCNPIKTHTL
jgi:hypothetical protein